ncbi:MAG: guanylate kinase [Verrucomicrobiia bacterium]
MNKFGRYGILFVLSAPSGAGKTTLRDALKQTPDFVYSVSVTTRPPRPGEVDGEDYHFVSRQMFEEMIARDELLYGTRRAEILAHLKKGTDVLLDIDTQGAAQIRACPDPMIQDCLADVFIMPPNLDELRRRLERRGTETPSQIAERLASAAREMQLWRSYRYTIISGSMEEDLQKFRAIMRAERYLSKRMTLSPVA